MDNKNIFKVNLKILKSDIIKIIPKIFYINDYTYNENKIIDETKEEYIHNLISKFLELNINKSKYWEQLDLLIYWDTESYFAYEIITGIEIPLLLISEYKNDNIGLNCNNYQYRNLFLYNYPLISNYGYYGLINCYNINEKQRLNLNFSIDDLNYLISYMENHKNKFETKLNSILNECKLNIDIMYDIMNSYLNSSNKTEGDDLIQRNYENEAEKILKNLKYRKKKD